QRTSQGGAMFEASRDGPGTAQKCWHRALTSGVTAPRHDCPIRAQRRGMGEAGSDGDDVREPRWDVCLTLIRQSAPPGDNSAVLFERQTEVVSGCDGAYCSAQRE